MTETITYQACPCCGQSDISPALEAEDYTVSHEHFPIWECGSCTARFTQQVPAAAAIGRYYQSAEYVSHSETRKGIINRLYHMVRSYTLQSKRKLVQATSKKEKGVLLDVGAGTGAFAAVMQEAGWQVTGLEPDDIARANAQTHHQLTLQTLDSLYSLPDAQFDVITMWHVLEHVHDLHGYLTTFQRILKPGGVLLVAVPNYTSYDAQVYGAQWAAYDVPRHLYHFSPESMRRLMQQHGFRINGYEPMWFDSYYVSMLSERYRTGKNNLLRALWNGLRSNKKAASSYEKCSSVIYIMNK
ncbi:class I SAM-dependent methyltransferase [Deminuibacter soli]|uniref:Class I SAM-dependent methyltransferase n=1 Tax=Deminuibacter soli TaxID=2291815 RepID=A0A3E1NI08_9BACT|nr:class I SAM-dependent methyltransferase [Deminuibacter soli]RFM27580.1 class I SAM-dependent methyltransferase [Deminuibacter soli]